MSLRKSSSIVRRHPRSLRGLTAGAIVLAATVAAQAQTYGSAFYSASVSANAVIKRSSGVQGATTTSAGVYELAFSRDVSTCAYVSSVIGALPGYATALFKTGDTKTVVIHTFASNGTPTNFAFAILVSCSS